MDNLLGVLLAGFGATFVCLFLFGRRARKGIQVFLGLSLVALVVAVVLMLLSG